MDVSVSFNIVNLKKLLKLKKTSIFIIYFVYSTVLMYGTVIKTVHSEHILKATFPCSVHCILYGAHHRNATFEKLINSRLLLCVQRLLP